MKLNNELEYLTVLALIALGEYESKETDELIVSIIDKLELVRDYEILNKDTNSLLILLLGSVIEIQNKIDRLEGLDK